MADGLNAPSCVLKVNVECCAACPKKVKRKLQKINGVYAVDVDAKNGLVSVRGVVQPSMLVQVISEKIGKKAELYAYEKNPKIQNKMLDEDNGCSPCKYEMKNQSCSSPDESNHRDKCDDGDNHDKVVNNEIKGSILEGFEGTWHQPQHGMQKKKHSFGGLFGKKSIVEPRAFGNFGGPGPGYARLPPPPPPPPGPLPPPPYMYKQHPPVYPHSPPFRITKPPRPYPYDFYEKKEPPVGNSAFHAFRDDNVNACSIM